MKVKTLIKKLEKCDPEARVKFGTFCGTASGDVRKVIREKSVKHVELDCKMTHYEGEKV